MALAVLTLGSGVAAAEQLALPPKYGAACSFEIAEGDFTSGSKVQKLGKGWIGQSLQSVNDTGDVYDSFRAMNCGDNRQFVVSTIGTYAEVTDFDASGGSVSWSFFMEHRPYRSKSIVDQLVKAAAGTRFEVLADDPALSYPYPEWKGCGCKLYYPDLAEASQ
jgi:hypothetical protein